MKPDATSSAREKILFYLKTKGPQAASQLAKRLGVTAMAVRQHLYQLDDEEQVTFLDERRKVGRPARIWRLRPGAAGRFPDSHGELAVGILQAARAAFGESGVTRLINERMKRQAVLYRRRIKKANPLDKRVAALCAIRREEGYMAEWSRDQDGSLLLVENHCPICAAAEECQDLCAGELSLFRKVLGEVQVKRVEHILAGDRRCVYRITRSRKRA